MGRSTGPTEQCSGALCGTTPLPFPPWSQTTGRALGDQLYLALDDATVIEIVLNADGRLFIGLLGHGVAPAGAASTVAAEVVIGSVANALQSEVPTTSGRSSLSNFRLVGTASTGHCRRWSPERHSPFAVVPRASFH